MASKRFTFLNWTKLILHCLKNRRGIYLPIVSVEYVFKRFQWVLKSVQKEPGAWLLEGFYFLLQHSYHPLVINS